MSSSNLGIVCFTGATLLFDIRNVDFFSLTGVCSKIGYCSISRFAADTEYMKLNIIHIIFEVWLYFYYF